MVDNNHICNEALIYAFLDGELSPDERTYFTNLLDTCSRTQTKLEQERNFCSMLKNHLHRESAPMYLVDVIQTGLTNQANVA